MTSVCWCQDRGRSWKLQNSILELCFVVFFAYYSLTNKASILLVVVLNSVFSVGFNNVVSVDMLRESFPLMDMVDHNRRPKLPVRY